MDSFKLAILGLIACALSFVYAANNDSHALRSLPAADGWAYTEIEDPWTVRPIGPDGSIPTDSEMPDILRQHSPFWAPDTFAEDMAKQARLDETAKRCDAARAAAHYAKGAIAFNVMVERLPDCGSNTGSTPVEGYIIAVTRTVDKAAHILSGRAAIDRFKALIPHTTIAGIEFRTLPATLRTTQVAMRGAEVNIEGLVGDFVVRIWGTGSKEDVEDLLLSLDKSLQRYVGR